MKWLAVLGVVLVFAALVFAKADTRAQLARIEPIEIDPDMGILLDMNFNHDSGGIVFDDSLYGHNGNWHNFDGMYLGNRYFFRAHMDAGLEVPYYMYENNGINLPATFTLKTSIYPMNLYTGGIVDIDEQETEDWYKGMIFDHRGYLSGWYLFQDNEKLTFGFWGTDRQFYEIHADRALNYFDYAEGRYYEISIKKSGSTYSMLRDGVVIAQTSGLPNIMPNYEPLYIGFTKPFPDEMQPYSFRGEMDYLLIKNTVR